MGQEVHWSVANLRPMTRVVRLGDEEWRARCEPGRGVLDAGASGWRLAVPVWFDTAIGYWTGEPDWALLVGALERALQRWGIDEILIVEGSEGVDASPGSWLPGGSDPGPRVLLVGRGAEWLVMIEAAGRVRWLTGGEGEAMLVDWAASEGLELVREDGAEWR